MDGGKLKDAPRAGLHASIELAREAARSGALDEALRLYEAAFARLPVEGDAVDAASLLRWIGTVHRQRGDLDAATDAYEASLAVAEAANLPADMASALNVLGIVAQFRAAVDDARALYERARELAEVAGDERLGAMVDQNIGTLANTQGDVQVALASYRSALGRFRRLGDDVGAARSLNNLGMASVDVEDWTGAESSFDEAFELADRVRDAELIGIIELNRAELYLKRGDHARARECCDRSYEVFARVDAPSGLSEACKFYGILFQRTGKPKLAEDHFRRAVELAASCEDRLIEAESHSEWALLHLAAGRSREALQCLNRASRLFGDLHARAELLDAERRLDGLEETYLRVVKAWGDSIESKDLYTAGHCQRVADYACTLAAELGFAGRDLTWLRMGAFLHDVGKTEVPAEILNKPGKLTDEEFDLMKRHTVAGDEIVADLNFPWDIRPVVRNHHERWDGSGYPDGIAGETIPLTARILCVADVFDALTTARSYRGAMPTSEALRIMDRDAGRILDPEIYAVFRRLIEAGQVAGLAA
jgi:putative nucleotidyltransferase with HDIG domain